LIGFLIRWWRRAACLATCLTHLVSSVPAGSDADDPRLGARLTFGPTRGFLNANSIRIKKKGLIWATFSDLPVKLCVCHVFCWHLRCSCLEQSRGSRPLTCGSWPIGLMIISPIGFQEDQFSWRNLQLSRCMHEPSCGCCGCCDWGGVGGRGSQAFWVWGAAMPFNVAGSVPPSCLNTVEEAPHFPNMCESTEGYLTSKVMWDSSEVAHMWICSYLKC
jgi:hypothetical protein